MNSDTEFLIVWLSKRCGMDGCDMEGEGGEIVTKAGGKMALNLSLGPAWIGAVAKLF